MPSLRDATRSLLLRKSTAGCANEGNLRSNFSYICVIMCDRLTATLAFYDLTRSDRTFASQCLHLL
ncbi:MAG: hypothetical protein V7K40_24120 [Nostoc sp.]|uniref:hypothetical protein n=1 Tax=Nostoc sp. TaxID=1180 RepID=UPI002FF5141C